ncbi:hypothetical protein Tco_1427526 [Tanacetum coccineum]
MEHLLGEDYLFDEHKPMKPYQITDATCKDSKISEVPLTSYMRKVAKLPEKPLTHTSLQENIEDTGDNCAYGVLESSGYAGSGIDHYAFLVLSWR